VDSPTSRVPPIPAPTCRNCGAEAPGAYCPACGQETALALPTAGVFLREAAGRYVALDGRFARTLFHLLFRPGFLTNEYFAGRRRRYIRPARLFLVLALALFAVLRVATEAVPGSALLVLDGDRAAEITREAKAAAQIAREAKAGARKAASPDGEGEDVSVSGPGFDVGLRFDRDLHAFAIGPEGWVRDHLQQRLDRFNRLGRQEKIDQIIGGALRYGPYALIALLPWFAFLLQIVYAGRRRSYPHRPRRYAEHLVYGAHNHAFACLALILAVAVPLPPLRAAAVLWMLGYFFWSMKVVYGGRWSGVVLRGLVVAIAYLTMFGLVTAFLLVTAIVLR